MSAGRVSIEQIIRAWAESWGDKFPRSREERMMQFNSFFETAKGHGYESADDFKTSDFAKILAATVNENYHNKANLKIWRRINSELLDASYITFFNIVNVVQGTYKEKHQISSGGVHYEPATDLVEASRPALDTSKLGPEPEMATTTLSEDDFLEQLERGTDE